MSFQNLTIRPRKAESRPDSSVPRQRADRDLRVLDIFVSGLPVSKGNLTPFIVGKERQRVVMVEGRRKGARDAFANWQAALRFVLSDAWIGEPLGYVQGKHLQAVKVAITFCLPRPASAPRYVISHTSKPDLDKLARGCLDAMVGIVVTDDRQVVELHAAKIYSGRTGAMIRVEPLQDADEGRRRVDIAALYNSAP